MELVDSLAQEMFEWRTPFCGTVLNDDRGSEGSTIPSLDAMLVEFELPEINLGPEEAASPSHPNPFSISLSPPNPLLISLLPSHSSRTIPVVTSAIQAHANTRNPLAVNTKPCSVQTGTRGFEIPALTTPMSSAPNTPPVLKSKGSRGYGTAKPKCPPKKKKSRIQKLGLDAAGPKSKENRVPTTAEHIIRERQRRDDMSDKYLILESLLPPAPKRERAVVVEDAISFVGAMQRKKAELLNRRSDLKLMASYNQSAWCKKTRSLAPHREPLSAAVNPFQCHLTKQRSAPENCNCGPPLSGSSDGVVVRANPVLGTSAGTISAIHVQLGGEVVMEMMWNRPRPNFQSALLQAVESLGFDVTQCSIFRVGNEYIQCVVTCSKVPLDAMKCSMLFALAVTGSVAENIRDTIFFDIDYESAEKYAHAQLIHVRKRSCTSLQEHPTK